MNRTNVVSRASTKTKKSPSSSSSSTGVKPRQSNSNKSTRGKSKKRSGSSTTLIGILIGTVIIVFVWSTTVLMTKNAAIASDSKNDIIKKKDLPKKKETERDLSGADQQQQVALLEEGEEGGGSAEEKNSEEPWYYGWSPSEPSSRQCSWRKCFVAKHGCASCRDSLEDLGNIDDMLATGDYDPERGYVPDPTILRRMFLKGVDGNGNPWPPTLDEELCENIGTFGGKVDDNIKLLDAVPIIGLPFQKTPIAAPKDENHPRLLCLVYTMESAHHDSLRAIRETWANGCDGFLAFSTKTDPRIPAVSVLHDGPEEYNNMWQKIRSMWKFVGAHYLNDYDYFHIGGDDLFILPENLKSYLKSLDPSILEDAKTKDNTKHELNADNKYYLGRRFRQGVNGQYFYSGGAGYTLSRGALREFFDVGLEHPSCNVKTHTSMEDVMIAKCLLDTLGMKFVDTRDELGRERYHPFSPGAHYAWRFPKEGAPRDWYDTYNREWGLKTGKDCCSSESVSFHYMKKPAMVRHLYSLLYTCKK